MTFDEHRLRAIIAIADTGSLGRAADQVNLSQPALSRMIHEMEMRLGRALFERHSKGMRYKLHIEEGPRPQWHRRA